MRNDVMLGLGNKRAGNKTITVVYHSIPVFGWLHSPPRRRNLQVPRVRYQPWCIVLVLIDTRVEWMNALS